MSFGDTTPSVPSAARAAEAAVLGGILIDPIMLPELRALVAVDKMQVREHRLIYAAMLALADKGAPIDHVSLKRELTDRGVFDEAGGDDTVDLLDKTVPASSNLTYYAGLVANPPRVPGEDDGPLGEEPPAEGEQEKPNGREVTITSLAGVRPKAIRYLWRDRIPLGKLTIVDGDPGTGKTTAMLDVAARLTTGRPMPGESTSSAPPSDVIVISVEDDAADTLVPRLLAAGADLKLVHTIKIRVAGREVMPSLDSYLPEIEKAIKEKKAKLLIVDPLMALLGSSVDGHKDQDVRQVLGPLKEMVERQGCAAVAIRHLNKAGIGPALYRGGGSIGLAGAARSVLAVGRDPQNPRVRVLAVTKSNSVEVQDVPSLSFELSPTTVLDERGEPLCDDDGTRIVATSVSWTGTSTLSADQLVSAASAEALEGESAIEEAKGFLRKTLEDGAVPSKSVEKQARELGIKPRTLKRARLKLGVCARRVEKEWRLELPATTDRRTGDDE